MDYNTIINHYYPQGDNDALRDILLSHSKDVALLARFICRHHSELNANEKFVYDASMIHDIGIMMCDAPAIHCHGTEHYLRHGLMGAEMLREYGKEHPEAGNLEPYARVCETHTGTGLSVLMIHRQHLPLPARNFVPMTVEEKIISYADLFYSKTHLGVRKDVAHVRRSLMQFGTESVAIFDEWNKMFG